MLSKLEKTITAEVGAKTYLEDKYLDEILFAMDQYDFNTMQEAIKYISVINPAKTIAPKETKWIYEEFKDEVIQMYFEGFNKIKEMNFNDPVLATFNYYKNNVANTLKNLAE